MKFHINYFMKIYIIIFTRQALAIRGDENAGARRLKDPRQSSVPGGSDALARRSVECAFGVRCCRCGLGGEGRAGKLEIRAGVEMKKAAPHRYGLYRGAVLEGIALARRVWRIC